MLPLLYQNTGVRSKCVPPVVRISPIESICLFPWKPLLQTPAHPAGLYALMLLLSPARTR